MADIHQSGLITTIHILGDKGPEKMEKALEKHSKKIRTTIIIPVLYSDYVRPAMKHILNVLKDVKFIHQLILALGGADKEKFEKVKREIAGHPIKITLLWMDNPEIKRLLNMLEDAELYIGPDGKGKSCWTSFGLALAQGDSDVLALHDSDIVTYSKEMLMRLIYPVVDPNLSYEFSKGFYARFSTKLHARVTRLFVIPLFKTLSKIIGSHPLIQYLNSFRYPLAGEFALKTYLTRIMRFPGDWGLEVSTLYEVYRNTSLKRIVQVEITHQYEHKHQVVSKRDATRGLHKMAIDIALNVWKNLAAEGIIISQGLIRSVHKTYLKIAEDMILNYHADAMMNGLEFDRHAEESIVETFYKALITASEQFLQDPMGVKMLPNWNRITSAYPDFLDELLDIVERDNKQN